MWPALLQLIELAPHVTRLVPMADRYLQSKADNGKAQRRALDEMGERLRGELALTAERITTAQDGVLQQLNQQRETLEGVAADLQAVRVTSAALAERMTRMEARISRLWTTLLAGLVLIFVGGVILVFVVLHARS
jgi:hypothetical protein